MPRPSSRARSRAGEATAPAGHAPGDAVLVLLTPAEPVADVVRRGSEAARQDHLPLEIVVLALDGTSSRACLATMDAAVQLARSIAPQVEIRAETSGLDRHLPDTGRTRRDHPLVVTGPRTWDTFVDRGDLRWLNAGGSRSSEPYTRRAAVSGGLRRELAEF